MSVYKSKRGASSAQFVETARKLQVHTLEQCLKVPKRYTFYLTQKIMDMRAPSTTRLRWQIAFSRSISMRLNSDEIT